MYVAKLVSVVTAILAGVAGLGYQVSGPTAQPDHARGPVAAAQQPAPQPQPAPQAARPPVMQDVGVSRYYVNFGGTDYPLMHGAAVGYATAIVATPAGPVEFRVSVLRDRTFVVVHDSTSRQIHSNIAVAGWENTPIGDFSVRGSLAPLAPIFAYTVHD